MLGEIGIIKICNRTLRKLPGCAVIRKYPPYTVYFGGAAVVGFSAPSINL